MNTPALTSQRGQLIVEAVLLLVALMAVVFATANYLKSNDVVQAMISGPWKSLAGMLQNGAWGSPQQTNAIHPSARGRHIAIQGESPQ